MREKEDRRDSGFTARMIEAAFGTHQLASSAFEERPTIHAILPVVEGLRNTCRLLIFRCDLSVRHWNRSIVRKLPTVVKNRGLFLPSPCKSKEGNADGLDGPGHVKRFAFRGHVRKIARRVIVTGEINCHRIRMPFPRARGPSFRLRDGTG